MPYSIRTSIISHIEQSNSRVDSGLVIFISINSHDNLMREVHWMAMKKVRLWEVKVPGKSHIAVKCHNQG